MKTIKIHKCEGGKPAKIVASKRAIRSDFNRAKKACEIDARRIVHMLRANVPVVTFDAVVRLLKEEQNRRGL